MSGDTGFSDQSQAEVDVAPPPAGDAGTNFLNNLFVDDPTDDKKVDAFNEGANHMKTLAENGGFAINEEGMQEYIKLCDTFLDGYAERQNDLLLLTERAKLGSSPYAYRVADFNVTVATGDERSLIHNLDLMKDGYTKLREAFKIARRNYNETEAEHDQRFRKFGATDA
jgi:hypothetical protein